MLIIEGWDKVYFADVQQAVIGASSYVNETLVAVAPNSFRLVEYEVKNPWDDANIAWGSGAAVIDNNGRIFPTDCVVTDLWDNGDFGIRVSKSVEDFLNDGVIPDCKDQGDQP